MKIFCCNCSDEVEARLTTGKEIYPHRRDLYKKNIWKCDQCGGYVGCHDKSNEPTKPLGVIPNEEIKKARIHLHSLIDPPWRNKKVKRGKIYAMISKELGYNYHTAEVKCIKEARRIYRTVKDLYKNQGLI